ncbi:HDIG domain-containing protein [Sporobacter termitidis DSM 10068]|uniref:Stage 0 sporulation protein A homolog n=1 Tax=Sporobacter termitidis DSM 10068 TaxID=1123282 RepID=A0A1M5XRD3_9FIRM|nr:HD domain-containing phosphohydrolase [Sporobacter termitidis]SHI02306.1 HDIG domain-containing protein [Sporobacter termitidis DSM 10068]
MRKRKSESVAEYNILALDDEVGILDSLSVVLKRNGYGFEGVTSPNDAVELIRSGRFDMLILDYMMQPINGDKVVERIREFDRELYILLLTGHKDMAPPLETIKALDIQGYCEKNDKFDQLILLVESAIKSIIQKKTIARFRDGLSKILDAVPKIYQLQPIGYILEGILSEAMTLVGGTSAFVLVDNTNDLSSDHKSIFRGVGDYNKTIEDFMAMLDPTLMEHIGSSRMTQQTVVIDSGIILPLINEFKQTIGVIYIDSDTPEDAQKLLEIYAAQAASAISNAFLHSLVNTKNDELNKTYDALRKTYIDTVEALRLTVDAKDEYTRGHSDRVAYFAGKVGKAFRLSEHDLETLRIGGIFHDIGKIGTSDEILQKADMLSGSEYEIIKQHPLKGAHILAAMSMFEDAVPLIKCHHEWVDGSGYPFGLKGEEIPFLGRILSVADAFDAMTSTRHYRSKLNLANAKDQLIKGSGTQFDESVVEVFIKVIVDDFQAVMEEFDGTMRPA